MRYPAAPPREPRLPHPAVPERGRGEGGHLSRVPPRAAAAHRQARARDPRGAPRLRRGDQRDHPQDARHAGELAHDPLLRGRPRRLPAPAPPGRGTGRRPARLHVRAVLRDRSGEEGLARPLRRAPRRRRHPRPRARLWALRRGARAFAGSGTTAMRRAGMGPATTKTRRAPGRGRSCATRWGRALRAMDGSGVFRRPRDRVRRRSLPTPHRPGRGRGRGALAARDVSRCCGATSRPTRRSPCASRPHGTSSCPCCRPAIAVPRCGRSGARSCRTPGGTTAVPRRGGSAQVYLDVSGSMDAEMPLIVALLGRLARYIRRPFWAFSDEVAPARIEGGRLGPTRRAGRA